MVNPKQLFKPGLVVAILLSTTLLTGCWDRTETNDIAFVVTSSVDLEDDGSYRVAYMFPLPGSMGGASGGGGGTAGGKSYYIDSEVGATFRDAFSKLQLRIARRIFLSHRRTIVIGEKLAAAGIDSLFDVLPRSSENRMTTFLVTTKGKGYDLLNAEPKFERFPAEVIRELSKSRQAKSTSMKDIGLALSFHSDPIISYLAPRDSKGANEPSHEIQFIGYAQFKGDRMVGIYQKKEANGLLWLRDQVKSQQLTFPVEDGENISILITSGKTAITPKLQDGQVSFDVKVEATGSVREDLSNDDLYQSEFLHKVEDKFAEQIKISILAAIKQMKKEGTDSAQLGLLVWRTHPQIWKTQFEQNWEHYFKEAEFNIRVKASIPETGVINRNVTKEGV
jgi:spore germination protein KC